MTRKFIVQICKQIVEKKVKDIKIALSSERYRRTEEHRHLVYHSSAPLREFPKKNGVAYASAADAVQTAAIDRVHRFTVTGFAMENDVGAPRRDLWILPARFALSARHHPLSASERKAVRKAGKKLYHAIGDVITEYLGNTYFDEGLIINQDDITLPPTANHIIRAIPKGACCYSIIAYPWSSAPEHLRANEDHRPLS